MRSQHGKAPVLKSAETRALLERARGGDKTAREELISGNLRLVLSVIQKFAGRGEYGRSVQVGRIGSSRPWTAST